MNQYIITVEELDEWEAGGMCWSEEQDMQRSIRSHPYNPQSELEIKYPSSTSLLLIAHDEWKRRQERKHMDDESPWISGWISGYLTSKKFVQERIEELLGNKP